MPIEVSSSGHHWHEATRRRAGSHCLVACLLVVAGCARSAPPQSPPADGQGLTTVTSLPRAGASPAFPPHMRTTVLSDAIQAPPAPDRLTEGRAFLLPIATAGLLGAYAGAAGGTNCGGPGAMLCAALGAAFGASAGLFGGTRAAIVTYRSPSALARDVESVRVVFDATRIEACLTDALATNPGRVLAPVTGTRTGSRLDVILERLRLEDRMSGEPAPRESQAAHPWPGRINPAMRLVIQVRGRFIPDEGSTRTTPAGRAVAARPVMWAQGAPADAADLQGTAEWIWRSAERPYYDWAASEGEALRTEIEVGLNAILRQILEELSLPVDQAAGTRFSCWRRPT